MPTEEYAVAEVIISLVGNGVVLDKYVPPEGDGKVIWLHTNDGTIALRRFDAGQQS